MSGHALRRKRGVLQRAERADASEASESSRKRLVAHLKLLTRQTTKPLATQTKNCTCRKLQTGHETNEIFVLGTAGGGARGKGEGAGPGLKPEDNENQSKMTTHVDRVDAGYAVALRVLVQARGLDDRPVAGL